MIALENTYSVLLVSASQRFNAITRELLPGTEFFPVHDVRSITDANQEIKESTFDIIVVNAPLPDDPGLKFAKEICCHSNTSLLLLIKDEVYDETYYSTFSSGVITLPKPVSTKTMTRALRILCSVRERMRLVEEKYNIVEKGIEDVDLITRAKLLLIECLKMTEPEAHKYISRQAMDKRVSVREAAEDIIRTYQ